MALVCLCRGNFYWPPHTTILFCSIFLDKIVLDTLKSRYHRSAPLGIDMTLLDKTADGKEQDSVDMSLQTNMFRVALDNPPDTMVLLTGDGSGGALGKGFLADIKRIHKLGWNIEVYAWESTCNRYLKSFAEENGIFVPLEKYYYSITFLKGERVVQPLVR